MGSDWHTVEGKRSLQIGKEWEGRLFTKLVGRDPSAKWISEDPSKWYDGHDMTYRDWRIEVKSNEGRDSHGNPYSTVCVERITKAGTPPGWMRGGSDVVVFINRGEGEAHFWRALPLADWIRGQRAFTRWDAECVIMPWEGEREMGYMMKIKL